MVYCSCSSIFVRFLILYYNKMTLNISWSGDFKKLIVELKLAKN